MSDNMSSYASSGPGVLISGIPGVNKGDTSLPSGNDVEAFNKLPNWNWGAFLFGWLWMLAMNPLYGIIAFLIEFFSAGCLAIPLIIYLGLKGNQMAWAYRSFRNRQEFDQVMKAWTIWGIIINLGWLLLIVLFYMAIAGMIGIPLFLGIFSALTGKGR